MYQVTITLSNHARPVFRTVDADSAAAAKMQVRRELAEQGIKAKRLTARVVF